MIYVLELNDLRTRMNDVLSNFDFLFPAGPSMSCPPSRTIQSMYEPGTVYTKLIISPANAISALTQSPIPVTYISSPPISLLPFSPHQSDITGYFKDGTTYILALATDNTYSVACFFGVTVQRCKYTYILTQFFLHPSSRNQ